MGGRNLPREIVIIRAARRLLEKGWTQGTWAKDRWGNQLASWGHPRAAKWCLLGALYRAADELGYSPPSPEGGKAIARVEKVILNQTGQTFSPEGWNDRHNRTKQEVLEILRIAGRDTPQQE
jgi:hypothetical protein